VTFKKNSKLSLLCNAVIIKKMVDQAGFTTSFQAHVNTASSAAAAAATVTCKLELALNKKQKMRDLAKKGSRTYVIHRLNGVMET